jgi:hypothetical protein
MNQATNTRGTRGQGTQFYVSLDNDSKHYNDTSLALLKDNGRASRYHDGARRLTRGSDSLAMTKTGGEQVGAELVLHVLVDDGSGAHQGARLHRHARSGPGIYMGMMGIYMHHTGARSGHGRRGFVR